MIRFGEFKSVIIKPSASDCTGFNVIVSCIFYELVDGFIFVSFHILFLFLHCFKLLLMIIVNEGLPSIIFKFQSFIKHSEDNKTMVIIQAIGLINAAVSALSCNFFL